MRLRGGGGEYLLDSKNLHTSLKAKKNAICTTQNIDSKITIINDFIENYKKNSKQNFDFIILSSLLHEVINPFEFLCSILRLSKGAILHINVPNAMSFHLLWAHKAGLIELGSLTNRAKSLQQHTTFTLSSLKRLLRRAAKACDMGCEILQSGSYFIKPFNHTKMQECLNLNIIDSTLLAGLEGMIEYLPDFGAEIYVNLKLTS